jgi:DNA-binding GntR family transcriptional regulator
MQWDSPLSDGGLETGRNRGTAVERVVDRLRDGILNSRFAPGQRLIEVDLTRDLGVSRGPLREAFRRLSAEGLIELVPNRGAVVRRLSLRETMELFQIRLELEGLAARLAAQNVGDPEVRMAFEAAIVPIWNEQPRLSSVAYLDENKQFHDAVMKASCNTQLTVVSQQLQLPLIMSQLSNALTAEILRESVCEHRLIAEAILARNPAAAEAEMRKHLHRAIEFTRGTLQANFPTRAKFP